MVTIQAKSQYQTQHGQIILITSEFCDWQYVKSCLNDNGLELSNDNHNGEMNAKLFHNALRCKVFYCFSYCWIFNLYHIGYGIWLVFIYV